MTTRCQGKEKQAKAKEVASHSLMSHLTAVYQKTLSPAINLGSLKTLPLCFAEYTRILGTGSLMFSGSNGHPTSR